MESQVTPTGRYIPHGKMHKKVGEGNDTDIQSHCEGSRKQLTKGFKRSIKGKECFFSYRFRKASDDSYKSKSKKGKKRIATISPNPWGRVGKSLCLVKNDQGKREGDAFFNHQR